MQSLFKTTNLKELSTPQVEEKAVKIAFNVCLKARNFSQKRGNKSNRVLIYTNMMRERSNLDDKIDCNKLAKLIGITSLRRNKSQLGIGKDKIFVFN